MKSGIRRAVQTLLIFAGWIGIYSFALAHAMPEVYNPVPFSVLNNFPHIVSVQFSEHIESRASRIEIFDPRGRRADTGAATLDPRDSRLYQTQIEDRGPGTYTVSWQVVSADDGHFASGAYTFSFQSPSAIEDNPMSMSVSMEEDSNFSDTTTTETFFVWLELVGQALLLGSLVVIFFVWLPIKKRFGVERTGNHIEARLAMLLKTGAALIAIATASYIINRALALDALQHIDFTAALAIFIHTFAGSYTTARLILGIFIFALTVIFSKKLFSGRIVGFAALGIPLLLIVFDRAMVSHAQASHLLPRLSVAINFVHLLFKDMWIGGLFAVAIVAYATKDSHMRRFASRKFSKLAAVALGVGGVSGCYVVWLHLKSFSLLFTNEWGILFCALSFVALIFLMLRLWQQFLLEKQEKFDVRRSNLFLATELFFGVVILLITAKLIITTPPLHQLQEFRKTSTDQGVAIQLTESMSNTQNFLLSFSGDTANPFSDVTASAINEEKNIGPIAIPVNKVSQFTYEFSKTVLSAPGPWSIEITARRPDRYDINSTITIDYPDDLLLKRTDDLPRTFGIFEVVIIASAIFIILLAWRMFVETSSISISSDKS